MWQSLKEYIPISLHWWWLYVIGVVGVVGIILQFTGFPVPNMPLWAWLLIIFLSFSIAQFLAFHKVRKQRNQVQGELKDEQMQSLMKKEPTLIEDFKKAKVVWGLWYAGTKARADKVLEENIPIKIILLKPDEHNEALLRVVKEAEAPLDEVIADIKFLTRRALNKKDRVQVGWFVEYIGYTLTIFDTKPQRSKNNELIPDSNEAWLIHTTLDPQVGTGERTRTRIFNKGKETTKFQAYLKVYQGIWEQRVRVKLQNGELVVDNE